MWPNWGAPQHGEMFLVVQTHQGESGSSLGNHKIVRIGADSMADVVIKVFW
jgi:hypothetical protein